MLSCIHNALTTSVSNHLIDDADVIGKNGLICITFDQLDCNRDFIATNGVSLNNGGVRQKARCGLDGACGRFAGSSVLVLPLFLKDFMFEFTFSVWFKRNKRLRGGLPTIYSLGDCDNAGLEVRRPYS